MRETCVRESMIFSWNLIKKIMQSFPYAILIFLFFHFQRYSFFPNVNLWIQFSLSFDLKLCAFTIIIIMYASSSLSLLYVNIFFCCFQNHAIYKINLKHIRQLYGMFSVQHVDNTCGRMYGAYSPKTHYALDKFHMDIWVYMWILCGPIRIWIYLG